MLELRKTEEIMREGMPYLFEATHYDFPVIARGEGSRVWDVDGNSYFDLNAGQFCMTFGHNYEPFKKAVAAQMDRIWHTNTATLTPEVFEAAKKMAAINDPRLCKTIFLSTGAEANECALRYAKFITGRTGMIDISRGYHGLTLAAQAATFTGKWAKPQIKDAYSVTAPDFIHAETDLSEKEFIDACIEELRALAEDRGSELAAMLIEPIIGAGGMVEMPARYLRAAREICDEHGILLIFDECQSGFGRTGEWFAYQRIDVVPDIITTAKAMGMGFAVSAVTFRGDIAARVEGKVTSFASHQNDPISSAIVSFVIDEIERLGLLEKNRKKGEYLLKALQNVCDKSEYLINARGVGLMCALDVNDRIIPDCRTFTNAFIRKLEDNGVLIQSTRESKTFRLLPSFLMTEEEIDELEAAFTRSILAM